MLDNAGQVRQFRLSQTLGRALLPSDVVHERDFDGTFSALRAGTEHVLALRSDGTVVSEGSNSRTWADGDASLAATPAHVQGWGRVRGTRSMTESFSASVKVHPVSGMPRSLTVGAVVGADGSVVYRTALFTSSGMRDLFGSGLSNYVMAN